MERQRFTEELKREAVRLLERGGKPVSQRWSWACRATGSTSGVTRLPLKASMFFVALAAVRPSSRS